MDELPTSEQASNELAPLIAALWVAFPHVRESIKVYFDCDGRTFDKTTATFLVRDQIVWRLKLHNYDVIEESDGSKEFTVQELALKGIEGVFGRWRFKILRSRDGLIPPPRDSTRRAAFYAQAQWPLPGLEPWLLHCDPQMRHNVVFLWDCDAEYRTFSLRIAMPLDPEGATTHFNVMVTRPIEEDDIDLDVRRREPAETLYQSTEGDILLDNQRMVGELE